MADYDLIIRNGRIVDGTGAPGREGSVAIRGDRIEAVGDVSRRCAAREIDAGGMVVAPGFVDVHAHDDAAVVNDPRVDFKIMQGVTTDVVGNCGAGNAPANDRFRPLYAAGYGAILGVEEPPPWRTTAEYFAAVDHARPAINVAAYVPHGVVRMNVMGSVRAEPDDDAAERDAAAGRRGDAGRGDRHVVGTDLRARRVHEDGRADRAGEDRREVRRDLHQPHPQRGGGGDDGGGGGDRDRRGGGVRRADLAPQVERRRGRMASRRRRCRTSRRRARAASM